MGWVCTSHLTGAVPELEVTGRGQTQSNCHGERKGQENIPTFYVPSSCIYSLSSSKQSCEDSCPDRARDLQVDKSAFEPGFVRQQSLYSLQEPLLPQMKL